MDLTSSFWETLWLITNYIIFLKLQVQVINFRRNFWGFYCQELLKSPTELGLRVSFCPHSTGLSQNFCFSHTFTFQLVFVSSLTLFAITADRYLFISSSLKYLLMIWQRSYDILSTLVHASLFPFEMAVYKEPTKVRKCHVPISFALNAAIIYVIIPLSLIFFYRNKFSDWHARRHVRRMGTNRVFCNHNIPSALSSKSASEMRSSYIMT